MNHVTQKEADYLIMPMGLKLKSCTIDEILRVLDGYFHFNMGEDLYFEDDDENWSTINSIRIQKFQGKNIIILSRLGG